MLSKLSQKTRAAVAGVAVTFLSLSFVPIEAEAKRMGSGGSFGRTAPSYNRQATPPSAPAAAPTTAPSKASTTTNPAGAAAAQPARNRFLGPIMGLAAGLGLAALFSHLGFGEGLANILGTLLMVGLAIFVIRKLFMMMRGNTAQQRPAYGAAGAGNAGNIYTQPPQPVQQPVNMNRDSMFGNPRSNDPRAAFDAAPAATGSTGLVKELPEGFDEAGFVNSAKKFFVTMQGLYDKGDVAGLREYAADEVVDHLAAEIQARGNAVNRTEILTLDAELIGFEVDVDEQLATVAFSGMLREESDAAAEDIREVWIMSRPLAGGGWVLAGIHNL